MNNRDFYQIGLCSLENLLDDNYTYRPDNEDEHDFMEESLYPDVYKRKQPKGYYAWENENDI